MIYPQTSELGGWILKDRGNPPKAGRRTCPSVASWMKHGWIIRVKYQER